MKKDFFYSKSSSALEFDKVMKKLAEFAATEQAKAYFNELLPLYDAPCVQTLMAQCLAAQTLLSYKPSFPMQAPGEEIKASLLKTEKDISLSAEQILEIGRLLSTAGRLRAYYEDKKFSTPELDGFFENLYTDEGLARQIERSFLPSGAVADEASAELAKIRKSIVRAGQAVKEELSRYIKSPDVSAHLQEPIVTLRSDRYVIPVKADNRGDITGLLHDTSQTGNTLFIEPLFVVEQNNKIKKLELEEQNEILRILSELSKAIGIAARQMLRSFRALTALDIIFAKAKYAAAYGCCTPRISSSKRLFLKEACHPLIDRKVMVPLSVDMKNGSDTVIVTGPNTGGKTVFLKTLGLLSLMAKAGIPVPAQSAELFIFDRVFADIGDEQSIEQSLSTFSSHMRNIKNIVASCGKNDLVLFDELGSGTDPAEGAALAVSVIDKIRFKGAFVAATTHYGELKSYALTTSGVQNASFVFDLAALRPTYQLQMGIPGKSYAFEISEKLGLDRTVIEQAKQRLSGEAQNMDQVLTALNEQRSAYTKRLAEMKSRERELLEQKAALEKERKKLLQGADNKIAAAEQKAKAIVESAKRQADLLSGELMGLREQMDKAQYKNIKSAVKRVAAKASFEGSRQKAPAASGTPLSEPPKVGQTVFVPALAKNAVVESVSGGQASVTADGVRMRLKIAALCEPAAQADAKETVHFRRSGFNRGVKTELDIRGMNVLDATEEIDRFIDAALLGKLKDVRIIHGKGTGVLRAGVHAHLRAHTAVSAFELAAFGQGDSGVTVVHLK